MKRAYFTTCAECGGPHPNEKGVCSHCEVEHGYANDNRPRTIFSDDEIWVPARNFEWYEVSSHGRVRRVTYQDPNRPPHVMRPHLSRDGYERLSMWNHDGCKSVMVSRIVCATFNGPEPDGGRHCAHKDGNRTNNRPGNLYWATPAENAQDKYTHGTIAFGDEHWTHQNPQQVVKGERHYLSTLTEDQVEAILMHPKAKGTDDILAAKYSVSASTINKIRSGKNWAHVRQRLGLPDHKFIPYAERTHCPEGHEYSGSNLVIGKLGNRACRQCKRIADAKRRARRKEKLHAN